MSSCWFPRCSGYMRCPRHQGSVQNEAVELEDQQPAHGQDPQGLVTTEPRPQGLMHHTWGEEFLPAPPMTHEALGRARIPEYLARAEVPYSPVTESQHSGARNSQNSQWTGSTWSAATNPHQTPPQTALGVPVSWRGPRSHIHDGSDSFYFAHNSTAGQGEGPTSFLRLSAVEGPPQSMPESQDDEGTFLDDRSVVENQDYSQTVTYGGEERGLRTRFEEDDSSGQSHHEPSVAYTAGGVPHYTQTYPEGGQRRSARLEFRQNKSKTKRREQSIDSESQHAKALCGPPGSSELRWQQCRPST
ncbi:hypothetical protein F5Y17DRAFT_53216 [Xylariaceae sp. FL0594]|nr:hypothetical protein F5Y17DRAFT_53216 [Xylariaceae sp. FL0594]